VFFRTENVKKNVFRKRYCFVYIFVIAPLLGHKFGLASELGKPLLITTEEIRYRRPLISSPKPVRREVVLIPFERGESNHYPNIKIFLDHVRNSDTPSQKRLGNF